MDTPAPATGPEGGPAPEVPRWAGLVVGLCALMFALVALEIGARAVVVRGNPTLEQVVADYQKLASHGPAWIRFVPDDEITYRLRPGFTLSAEQGDRVTRHNSAGFRTAEFAPKSAGTLRIACYGGSTTYGVSVADNDDTYPAQLEHQLNGPLKPAGWDRVEVFNLGVGGYTSREILGTMKRTLPELQPDVVLIQNAINDVIPRFYPDYQLDYSHYRTDFTPMELGFASRMACRSQAWLSFAYMMGWIRPLSLQSQAQRPMPPVDEALINLEMNRPTAYEANLSAMIDLARASGSEVWLLTQAYLDVPAFAGLTEESRRLEGGYRRGLAEHTEIVIRLAREKGVGLIELHKSTPREQRLFADPIHMNVAGNEVKGRLVAEAIAPALNRPAAPN